MARGLWPPERGEQRSWPTSHGPSSKPLGCQSRLLCHSSRAMTAREFVGLEQTKYGDRRRLHQRSDILKKTRGEDGSLFSHNMLNCDDIIRI